MASEIKGLDSLIAKLNALGGNVQEALDKAVRRVTDQARSDAQANIDSNKGSQADSSGTGALRGSISERFEYTGGGITGIVFSNAPHAMFVEYGTGPVGAANHAGVSPNFSKGYTSKKSWTYRTTIGGKVTYRRTSGMPARPFLYPAAKMNEDTFQKEAELQLRAAIQRTAGGG